MSPHPLFDPEFYLGNTPRAQRSLSVPFVDFLARGVHEGGDPHPLFDTDYYCQLVPAAADHPYGAFGHFLESPGAPWPNPDLDKSLRKQEGAGEYLSLVRRATGAHRKVPDYTGFRRLFDHFDHEQSRAFVARMQEFGANLEAPPKVSVILPTKDRADVLPKAIDSVRGQSYPHWELIVVDDGGSDSTRQVVAEYESQDDRIRYLHQSNTGVAGARNLGIRASSGDYLAYIDSDNTWVPEFLEVMVSFIQLEGIRAAYSASELRADDKVHYRGQPLNIGALRERNYIDCITIVHERSLVDEIGAFDERLRRAVDWDLLIRLADATDLRYAPFIGTTYDLWERRDDRLSRAESDGYRHVVRAKHWVRWDRAPAIVAGRLSILMSLGAADGTELTGVLELARTLDRQTSDAELVVVDDGLQESDSLRLRVLEQLLPNLTVATRFADAVPASLAYNLAASRSSGDVLVVVNPRIHFETDDDTARLAEAVRRLGSALIQPTIIYPDGTVRTTGQILGPQATAISIGHGMAADDPLLKGNPTRDGVDGFAFAVDARSFRRLRGLDPLFVRGGGDLDLGLRAADLGIPTLAALDVVVKLSSRPKRNAWSPSAHDRTAFVRRWSSEPPRLGADDVLAPVVVEGLTHFPGDETRPASRWTPTLRRAGAQVRRWAIKTSVPDTNVRNTWGDWHFACALRDALVGLGEHAVVDLRTAWYRPTTHLDDINLVLRGTQRFEPIPGKINIAWVLSHPNLVSWDELRQFDRVYVASRTFPETLSMRWPDIEGQPLLQCTDPERFYPDPAPDLHEDLLFVGNSRNIMRGVIADVLACGMTPAVYGSNWEHLIPEEFVRGTYLPNDELRLHYSSAGVVLNDHWADMREHGFISNRVFDAVACGAVVVSDDVPGLNDLFGDRVVTYRGGEVAPAIEEARRRSHEASDYPALVAGDHSFRARATQLVDAARELMDKDSATASDNVHLGPAARSGPRQAGVTAAPPPQRRPHLTEHFAPVFVGGTGRSGTTITARLVASSGKYSLIPVEARFHADEGGIPDLYNGLVDLETFEENMVSKWYYRSANFNGQRGLHVLSAWLDFQGALEQLRKAWPRDPRAAIRNLIHDFFDPVARRYGSQGWVEMTPTTLKTAHTLGEILPEAKFIHVARDGRDVAASIAKWSWGPDTLHEAIDWWCDELIAIAGSLKNLGAERTHDLRLESLVGEHGSAECRRLADFLGLDQDDRMQRFLDLEITQSKANIARWRQGLSTDDLAAIDARYGDALRRLEDKGIEVRDLQPTDEGQSHSSATRPSSAKG